MTKVKKNKFLLKEYSWLLLVAVAIILFVGWLIMKKLPIQAVSVDSVDSLVDEQVSQDKLLEVVDTTINNPKVIVNPYKISPLSAVVLFKTDEAVAPKLTVVGKDSLSTFSHTFEKSTKHRLPVYGLYADHANKIRVEFGDIKKEITIQTEPLPDDFTKLVDVKAKKEFLTNDLYFMTNSSINSKTLAYDVNGDVRWYLTEKLGWELKRSKQTGKIFVGTKRLNKAPYYRTGFYEIDMLGRIYSEYTIPGGYHHDLYERENGNIIAASGSTDDERKTVEDVVVEIDRKTGKVIREIDLSKIWPMDTGKSISWSADDWFHNNSVWLDEKTGELLLSGRHQDAVAVLDYNSAKLKYIIGSPEGWSSDMQKYFLKPVGDDFEWQWQQHAAKTLPNGDILIFDNGNNKSKQAEKAISVDKAYSRAVIYRVNQAEKTIEQVWQYGKERGKDYFSPYISEADYLGEGHYLVHSGGVNSKNGQPTNMPASLADADTLRSYTTEIFNDRVVFELVNNQNQYRAEKMPVYTKSDTGLRLSRANLLGEQIASHTCSDIPVKKAKSINREYDSHDIKLVRERDRLSMSGTFDKEDIVRLSLVGSDKQLTYSIPVDNETESKAMCIDIFNYDHKKSGNTKKVEGYVNARNLSGEFRIYISIQDKIYDTGKKVIF